MSQYKRERSRDKERSKTKKDEIVENKTSSSESNKDSNKDSIKDSNDSSKSNSFLFQTEEKKDSISVKKVSISGTINFANNLSNIHSPCILKNEEFINRLPKDMKDEETRTIPNSFFKILKQEDIIYVDENFNKIQKIKNSIIFNSNLFDKINENDKIIFDKFHNYLTAFYKSSKISDFCFDKDIYFPFSYNDNYYEIEKRDYTHGFRVHHYDFHFGNITHHFGIKGIGKSLCGRAIIYNYLHFKILKKSGDVFFPAIFFNYKLLKERLYDKPFLLYILKYETINLFRNQKDWINFYEQLNKSLNNNSVVSIIHQIASLYISKFSNQKFLIIIDQYSFTYDEDKDIEKIKSVCKEVNIFDLFIIYSIEAIEDQIFFIRKFIKNTFIESEPLDILSTNYITFQNHEVSCYYKYEYRNYKLLQKYFPGDIPVKYNDYFGDNISYFFQFKCQNQISFSDFVEQIKDKMAENIHGFYKNNYYSYQKLHDILSKIILNENKIINENIELFDNINGSYFIFYKYFDKNNNITYKYTYAFPLVKVIYEDFLNATDINFFIDIKNPKFLEMDGVSMGVCFDNFMNWWFKKKSENKLFEFPCEDIEVYNINYLIKKNTKNFNIRTMYTNEYIFKEIEKNEDLKIIKDQFYISNSKKCILVFQKFNAKSIDILFIIKINNNNFNDNWVLNSFQIKCSDNFEIDEKLLFENKYEMTYLRNKIKLIFKINIIKSYITYISIYEKPKLCATKNRDKFIYYSIEDDKVVDKNNQELINIPLYDGCYIPFVDEINENKILELTKSFIIIYHFNLDFNIIPALKDEVIIDGIQQNNSVILTIIKNEINLTSIVNKKINKFKNKSNDEIFDCEKYYKVQIKNNN